MSNWPLRTKMEVDNDLELGEENHSASSSSQDVRKQISLKLKGASKTRGRPRKPGSRGRKPSRKSNETEQELEVPEVLPEEVTLQAITFAGPPEPLHNKEKLRWDHKVSLMGEKVVDPTIHCCEKCALPILIYGRMIPCKHVFCLDCAKKTEKHCPRCSDPVTRIEQSALGTVFVCAFGGTKHGVSGCRRTYLSSRDLQAHISYRHLRLQQQEGNQSRQQQSQQQPHQQSQQQPPHQQSHQQSHQQPPHQQPPHQQPQPQQLQIAAGLQGQQMPLQQPSPQPALAVREEYVTHPHSVMQPPPLHLGPPPLGPPQPQVGEAAPAMYTTRPMVTMDGMNPQHGAPLGSQQHHVPPPPPPVHHTLGPPPLQMHGMPPLQGLMSQQVQQVGQPPPQQGGPQGLSPQGPPPQLPHGMPGQPISSAPIESYHTIPVMSSSTRTNLITVPIQDEGGDYHRRGELAYHKAPPTGPMPTGSPQGIYPYQSQPQSHSSGPPMQHYSTASQRPPPNMGNTPPYGSAPHHPPPQGMGLMSGLPPPQSGGTLSSALGPPRPVLTPQLHSSLPPHQMLSVNAGAPLPQRFSGHAHYEDNATGFQQPPAGQYRTQWPPVGQNQGTAGGIASGPLGSPVRGGPPQQRPQTSSASMGPPQPRPYYQ